MNRIILSKEPQMTKKTVLGGVVVFFIASLLLLFFMSGFHHAKAAKPEVLNFTSVSVRSNDTLWGIATEYYSEEYGSVKDYVKEIKRCNSLSCDRIQAGTSIIVPIYVKPKTNPYPSKAR